MKKYRRIEITAFRRRITIVSGAPAERNYQIVSLTDTGSNEMIRAGSEEGQEILIEAIRLLEERIIRARQPEIEPMQDSDHDNSRIKGGTTMNKKGKIEKYITGLFVTIFLIFTADTRAVQNGKIAFTGYGGEALSRPDIFTINSDGSDKTRLTNVGNATLPSYSPDGTRIAFYQAGGLYLMNADGSNQILLAPDGTLEKASWSPDGGRIAFECGGICIINTDGTGRTQIDANPADYSPDWSPDGTKIAFTKGNVEYDFFKYEIFVIDADGGNRTRLTSNFLPDTGPVWSPDGSKLAFTQFDDCFDIGNGEILCFASSVFTMSADGSNQTFLTGGDIFLDSDASDPSWSPDGSKIAFRGYKTVGMYSRAEVFVIDSTGGIRTNLTNTSDVEEYAADWGSVPVPTVSVSGRVTTLDGRSLRNAVAVLTDSFGARRTATTSSFGNFRFDNVATGEAYVIGVSSKRYRFASRNLIVTGSLTDVDFVGLE